MHLHHVRNATLLIEVDNQGILVDPMLGPKGSLPPFTLFRFQRKRNPTVALPDTWQQLAPKVTHCLITHLHPDHFDEAAKDFLIERNIPVICSIDHAPLLEKAGLQVVQQLKYGERQAFLEGQIEGIPARHGYGFVAKPMGKVMGFYIELPKVPSIYISADTILTPDVKHVLQEYAPQLSILAGGSAQLDIFKPLLMTMDDILKFVQLSPHKVLINHLEALNHCPTTREELRARLSQAQLSDKVLLPEDGESIALLS